jgi:RNA polymerase sigma-70 factor (ECF subfamily)
MHSDKTGGGIPAADEQVPSTDILVTAIANADADRSLVAAMRNGDAAAFRMFFDTYFPRVYRFALHRLGGDVEAGKEVVQSTLIKAMRSLAGFRGEAALFSWLCQICRHQIVDYLRIHKRHADHIVLIDDNAQLRGALESIKAPAADEPLHAYEASQTRRLVQFVLDRLPSRYGDVLEWKYVEGRGVAEIGELMGIGHTAAQSVLARARTAFREALRTTFGSTARDILASMRETKACQTDKG